MTDAVSDFFHTVCVRLTFSSMRPISQDTRELINQLSKPVSFWGKASRARVDAEILSTIGDLGESAAIIDIVPFVLSDTRRIAEAAAAAVHKLTAATAAADLAWLDTMWRERSPYNGAYRLEWHRLSPATLERLELFGEPSVSLLGMASFHESGHVREEAVNRLDSIAGGVELPFLLIRLNDWVPEVREVARRSISSRMNSAYGRSFTTNLALISRLEQTERVNHRRLIDAINELLLSAECRPVLLEALSSDDRLIRRASFKLAIHSREPASPEVLRKALSNPDTVVRFWAARRVSSAFDSAELDHLLTLMKRDRFMPVRREALRAYVNRGLEEGRVELRSALLDTHASMREEARYRLQEIDPIEVASFYRQALSAGNEIGLYSAISGLGETGSSADSHVLERYTSHSSAKIRRAAIRALSRLGEEHLSALVDALSDEVPSVSREALKALSNRASLLGNEQLWKIFCAASHRHIKRNALSLLEKVSKWEGISFMVKALCDADEEVANSGRLGIQHWLWRFNRRFSAPTPEQLAKLGSALEECGNLLDKKTRDELRFAMKMV